jgi:hypothetical protein
MNNSSRKINQNAKEDYTEEEVYRNNSKLQNSNTKLSSIFNKNISNKNNALQNGGNKDYKICMKILDAFNNNNLQLALSLIVDNLNINLACQDDNGNSILHHLVLCLDRIKECKFVLERLLRNADVSCIINSKNYKGQTPMLLAVFNGQNSIARKLEKAGANKNIEDNDGNYVITDATDANTSMISQNREQRSDLFSGPSNQGNIALILNMPEETDNISSLGLTPMTTDNSFNLQQKESDMFINLIQDNLRLLAQENKPQTNVSKAQNESVSENKSATEDFISQLQNRYNKNISNDKSSVNVTNYNLIIDSDKTDLKQLKPFKVVSDTSSVMPTNNRTLSGTSETSVSNPVNKSNLDAVTKNSLSTTDKLTVQDLEEYIKNIKDDQRGGKSKIVGWRKLILHSDLESGDMSMDEPQNKKKHKENKEDDDEDDEDEEDDEEDEDEDEDEDDEESESESEDNEKSEENSEEPTNELKRLINSRKNELHTEVLNNIMEMLNKGEITQKNKPLEASERNAKLIKSFLYKQVSDKNPQLTGMDKILIIQKMNKSELLNHLKKLPDLDQLEKTIEEHIKNKRSQKEQENSSSSVSQEKTKKENKKNNKSKSSEEDSD